MPIFFPDNDKRKSRVIELGSDAQNYLFQAQSDYEQFETLLTTINNQIANTYEEAGLTAPPVTSVDIFKAADVDTGGIDKTVDVIKIIADIAGFVGTVKYLAPGATRALVATGVMAEDTAARVLAEFTIPLVDREVTITVGDVAGSIIGGIVGGVAIVGVDLAIDAIEGSIARDKLRKGINTVFPLRAGTRLSQLKARTLLDSLTAVRTTLDAIAGAGIPLTDELIQNLIKKDVQPSVDKSNAITADSVKQQLKASDQAANYWTNEDPS